MSSIIGYSELMSLGISQPAIRQQSRGSDLTPHEASAIMEPMAAKARPALRVRLLPHPTGGRAPGWAFTVARQLAELIGGDLSVESALGGATHVTLRISIETNGS